jgi:hypothetical protein
MIIERKELLDFMNIDNLHDKSDEEQKEYLSNKIIEIEKFLNLRYTNDSYTIDRNRKFLSGRQISTLQNVFICLNKKEYLNAYLELWDYVDDYQSLQPITIGEFDILYFLVEYYKKEIEK